VNPATSHRAVAAAALALFVVIPVSLLARAGSFAAIPLGFWRLATA
jgi:hypothetical protein